MVHDAVQQVQLRRGHGGATADVAKAIIGDVVGEIMVDERQVLHAVPAAAHEARGTPGCTQTVTVEPNGHRMYLGLWTNQAV